MNSASVPIVTIDGPNASGKGTVSQLLANRLDWHLLDSGALYRLVGLEATRHQVSFDHIPGLVAVAENLDVCFMPGRVGEPTRVNLQGEDVTVELRDEKAGEKASKVAMFPAVRNALLQRQRAFARPPGLVADGRDMGTVVFPDAQLKIFLTASPEVRALRRHKQLSEKGINVNLAALSVEIAERDRRDRERETAPLKPAPDALEIDTSALSVDAVLSRVLSETHSRGILSANRTPRGKSD